VNIINTVIRVEIVSKKCKMRYVEINKDKLGRELYE